MADRCEAKVYRRDTYRRCGGRRHFKLHYAEGRCDRLAKENGFCLQHARLAEKFPNYITRAHER